MEFINSPAAKAAKLPFSQAVRVGDVLYLSGMLGNVPGTAELVPGGLEAEARQTMENIRAVLAENGLGFDAVFKCTVMLADIAQWAAFNRIYLACFDPARLLRSGPAARALRLRRERTGARRAGRGRVLGLCADGGRLERIARGRTQPCA